MHRYSQRFSIYRILQVTPNTFHNPDHDYYVQSKGHCAEALRSVVLADCGYFPPSDLDTLNHFNSHYIGHPTRKVNGVEQNTGALNGHGLAFGVGGGTGRQARSKGLSGFHSAWRRRTRWRVPIGKPG